ncbi:ATP-binding protein [Paenibacillus hodogayensis]|uniref:histidine kinase n=1 Tax=Paenibacillus hodogayensis TaxID=279208 RepID=A0ABV5VPR8_9BACL
MSFIRHDRFLQAFFALTLVIVLFVLHQAVSERHAPNAEQGVLDLKGWDLAKRGLFSLDGEWEFYPNRLLTPAEIANSGAKPVPIRVPGNWDDKRVNNGIDMPGQGYGTYRLVIRNVPEGVALAISKRYVRFADTIFVNGHLMESSGMPGISRETYVPRNVPYTVHFRSDGSDIDIVLQAANFDFRSGGIYNSILFGPKRPMDTQTMLQTGLELVTIGILLLFGLLFLYLFFRLHRDGLQLLYAFFFLGFAMVVFTNGERLLLQLFPELPFELAFKIKYVSVYAVPVLAFLIVVKIAAGRKTRIALQATSAIMLLYALLVVAAPFRIYSAVQELFYVMMLLGYATVSSVLLRQYVRGRYGKIDKPPFQLLLTSVWIMFLNSILSILNTWGQVSQTLLNGTTLVLLLAFAWLLVYQYVRAYDSMQRFAHKLQTADRMKDDFLRHTSHELNSPLHSIIHLSRSLLAAPVRRTNEADMREKLQLIRNTAYRMSNLVNDLIDVSRFKDGNLKVAQGPVDIASCLSAVVEVFGFLAAGKGIEMTRITEPEARYVLADESRLLQVLYSLVYDRIGLQSGGEIRFESRRHGDTVRIAIRHEGCSSGTAATAKDEPAEPMGGLGAGLSLAAELVRFMGGELAVREAESTLEIVLPSAPVAAEETAAGVVVLADTSRESAPTPRMGETGKPAATIMLATTDLVDMEHMSSLLSTEGFHVTFAGSDAAVKSALAGRDRPDLLILDVLLPAATGYALCKQIRREFSQAELPILLIHSRSTPADVEASIAAGGNDFIARPLDAGEILVRVHTLLGMKRLVKEAADNEMAFLRSQIKPHFLYNALGTIMSLCYTDGPRAGELLGTFSRYLRILFHLDNTEATIPLSKEMELVQAYAEIERERFGPRLNVEFDIDRSLYRCRVLPLLIEPLVENAIRHGVSRKISGGTVRLTIVRHEELVKVVVKDDGVGMTPQQVRSLFEPGVPGQGIGLRNMVRRLKHLNGQAPVIESVPDEGTTITIQFPYQ